MPAIRQFVVDAFASRAFEGNPAAVCPLEDWLDPALMQAIAAENNLSETAFFVPRGQDFELRWFAPLAEVDLCGHATLAAAHVLFEHLDFAGPCIRFHTRSGILSVTREAPWLTMCFPVVLQRPCAAPAALIEGLGQAPLACWQGTDYLALYPDAASLRALRPDFRRIEALDRRGIIVTAPGEDCDFVSRFFAPKVGIDEDPVTGSAHCQLAPFWAERLNRTCLQAIQLSPRSGRVQCELDGDQVLLRGQARTFLQGSLCLDR